MKKRSLFALVLAAGIAHLWSEASARAQGIAPEPASAAIASGSSIQFDHTVVSSSNAYLVVGVSVRSSAVTVSSISYGGVALRPIVAASAGGYCRAELWGLAGPAPGAHPVQVTLSGSNSSAAAGAISYAGVDQAAPVVGSNSANGNKGDVAVTLASVAGQRVVDCICGGAASAPTGSPASGQTERWKLTAGNVLAGSSDREGGSASSMNWTLTALAGQGWGSSALTLRPATVMAGTGGMTGSTGTGGSAGSTGTGGMTGSAGMGGVGGMTGSAGMGGTGGMTGSSGMGGSAGTTGTGGMAGSAGMGGAGGSPTGPTDAGGAGGMSSSGGPADGPVSAGGGAPGLDAPTVDDAAASLETQHIEIGCACELGARPHRSSHWLIPLGLFLVFRRRQRL